MHDDIWVWIEYCYSRAKPMILTLRDTKRLKLAHPALHLIVLEAARITTVPFMVMEVGRSVEKQRENIKRGVSWTMHSRHILSSDGLARAADLVPIDGGGVPIWAWPVYYRLAPIIKKAAQNVRIPVEWGGDWTKQKDGPHWQLPWKLYP